MVCPPPRGCCVLRRRINRDKRGGAVPLSTYENIIPQCGKFVKRLAAVFKKNFGDFFWFGRRAIFLAEWRVGFQHEGKVEVEREERKKKRRKRKKK